jgi:chromate transport protein ChrA
MITTTTTTTVASIGPLATTLGAAVAVFLLVLLFQKELTVSSSKRWIKQLSKSLNIAIYPLLLAFAFTGLVKLISIVFKITP